MNGLLIKEKVLELIKLRGPQIPIQIATQLKINSTFAGAFLSELISEGKVKYTVTLKIGGSPLYYVPGQETQLLNYTKHLNQREKEAYDLLTKEKIIEDGAMPPVLRVAMRALKDFAIPLRVTTDNGSSIFWKLIFLNEQDMHTLLESKLNTKNETTNETPQNEVVTQQPSTDTLQQIQQPLNVFNEQESTLIQSQVEKQPLELSFGQLQEKPKRRTVKQPNAETPPEKTIEPLEKLSTFVPSDITDPFMESLFEYFTGLKIKVVQYTLTKKQKEVECTVQIPTPLGDVTYFCLAKNKKRSSDADISAGYVKANTKHLPYIFISTADLSGKVKYFVMQNMPNTLIKTLCQNGN